MSRRRTESSRRVERQDLGRPPATRSARANAGKGHGTEALAYAPSLIGRETMETVGIEPTL
jgi:hypothetical protein